MSATGPDVAFLLATWAVAAGCGLWTLGQKIKRWRAGR